MYDIQHVKTVAVVMQSLSIQMDIPTALYVTPVPLGMRKNITITKCLPMYNSKDLPYGCNEEVYQNRRAKNIRSSETENFYATIITQATEYFREQK